VKFYGGSTAYAGGTADSFYAGGALSTLVPKIFTVSLNGRPYMIDLSQPFYRQYRRQIAPLIRSQADTSKLPGEHSLDPNGLWRRSFEDWSEGAGQRYLDRDTSVANGFYTSKGVDALTEKWQIGLLPDTVLQRATTNSNVQVVAANGYLYVADGQTLAYTSTLTGTVSWTTVTGTPADTISSICTDGYTVYACYAAGGLYQTVAGTATATQLVTSALAATAVCGYVNGRLMVASGQSLYNIVSPTAAALPTALLTTNNPNSAWVGFAAGNNNLYAAVNIGGVGVIYGTATTADGTSLTGPTPQATLPAGEKVASVLGYLGQLIVGTSLGVRYCQTGSNGGISLGALIATTAGGVTYTPATATQPVQALAGYSRWVWFGWTDYDGGSSGLGRVDLENFVVSGVLPAYQSDRMATAQGAVTSCAVLDGTVVFTVAGSGVYIDTANLVASGTIDSGYILYDLTDPKIGALLDIETVGPLLYGTYSAAISVDGAPFASVGTHQPGQAEPVTFGLTGQSAERFETRLTLNRDADFPGQGPTITRWTLRVYPAPRRPITWQLPLMLDERIVGNSMSSTGYDPFVELQALEQMAANGEPVVYQESNQSYQVFVLDVQFLPDELTSDKHYFNGLCLVTLEGLPVPYSGS
jgi:hypothetical protein